MDIATVKAESTTRTWLPHKNNPEPQALTWQYD